MTIKDFLALCCDEDVRIKIYDYSADCYVDEFWLSDYRKNPGNHPIVDTKLSCYSFAWEHVELFIND